MCVIIGNLWLPHIIKNKTFVQIKERAFVCVIKSILYYHVYLCLISEDILSSSLNSFDKVISCAIDQISLI